MKPALIKMTYPVRRPLIYNTLLAQYNNYYVKQKLSTVQE